MGKKVNCVVHFLRLSAVWWPGAQRARDNHFLACNSAKYSLILNFFSLADSAINLSYVVIDNPHHTLNMLLHYFVIYVIYR